MQNYDVIVVGGGPAGTAAAYSFSEQGRLSQSLKPISGEELCPNRGCDPKKILMSAVEAKGEGCSLSRKRDHWRAGY